MAYEPTPPKAGTGRRQEIWDDIEAQERLAHLALLAANQIGGEHPEYMELLRQVAFFAKTRGNDRLSNLIAGRRNFENAFRSLEEKFRGFLRRTNGSTKDYDLLNELYMYLTSDDGCGFVDNNNVTEEIWKRQIKNTFRNINFEFSGDTADSSLPEKRKYSNIIKKDGEIPVSELMTVARIHFGTTEEDFYDAAYAMTGRRNIDGQANFNQKGYWACYRFSTEQAGRIVKSRLVVTPPESKFKYCRFQHYLHDKNKVLRASEGLVLPIGERIYFIGTIGTGKENAGLEAICFENPTGTPPERRTGLIISNNTSNARTPFISRCLAIRERPEHAVLETGGRYIPRNADLGNFSIHTNKSENTHNVLSKFYKGTMMEERILESSHEEKSEEFSYTIDMLRNFQNNIISQFRDKNIEKFLEIAIQL